MDMDPCDRTYRVLNLYGLVAITDPQTALSSSTESLQLQVTTLRFLRPWETSTPVPYDVVNKKK